MKTRTVTATEANRSFSKLLRAVERGERVEISSHGRIVAIMAPAETPASRETRVEAIEKLKQRWADPTRAPNHADAD
jgi:prevent-host-death family protein